MKIILSILLSLGISTATLNVFSQEEVNTEDELVSEEILEETITEEETISEDEEVIEMKITPRAVFNDPGITLQNYSTKNGLYNDRYISVYLKAGETLRLIATYVGDNVVTTADDGKYFITSPSGTQVSVDYPDGERQPTAIIPDPVNGVKSVEMTATEEGIYIVSPSSVGTSNTQHDLNFNIVDASGSHQAGRVWIDYLHLEQINMIDWSGTGDFIYKHDYTLYHVTSTGYIYRQTLTGYNGLGSSIYSNPIGVTDVREEGCTSVYGDTPWGATTIYSEPSAECKSLLLPNHIFLEQPDASLPKTASTVLVDKEGTVTGTKDIYVLPLIAENTPTINDITFERSSLANNQGTFTMDIENHQGNVHLMIAIDYDNDGVIDETLEKVVTVNSYGETTYEWDGLNSAGEPVGMLSRITAEVLIDKAGEAHFVMGDVEVRAGMSVERLTAIDPANVGDGTLYYNASILPFDAANSRLITLPSPIEGSYDSLSNPTFRGWSMVYYGGGDSRNSVMARLPEYDGRPTNYTPGTWQDPDGNNWSFGDGNYIDDWTYEPVDIRLTKEIPLLIPNVTIEKEVDKTIASMGDELMYSLVVTNNELYPVPNIQVMDEIILDGNKEYIIDSVTVDGVEMSDVLDTDSVVFEDNTVIVNIIELAAEQESVITFTIKVLDQAEGQTLKNSATMTAPNHEEPIESNEVETYIPYLPRAINYYDCDKILIHQEWVDYGTNGKDAPSGYIYDLGLTVNVIRNTDVYAIGGCGFSIPKTADRK